MYDGTAKPISRVRAGDDVMGADSTRRRVLAVKHGVGELYRVTQGKGNGTYVVDGRHGLSVKRLIRRSEIGGQYQGWKMSEPFDLVAADFLAESRTFRSRVVGYKVALDMPKREVHLDPYFLGVWLGDGTSSQPSITTADPEIAACVRAIANSYALLVSVCSKPKNAASTYTITTGTRTGGARRNPVMNLLKGYNIWKNKHIPKPYLMNDRSVRQQVLAGLIDTDGHFLKDGGGYELTQKSEQLVEDCVFLARSLGLHAVSRKCEKTCVNNGVVGQYHRIYLSGDLADVPMRLKRKQFVSIAAQRLSKDKLNHQISIEPVGIGEYFRLEVDGDSHYLMADLTVV